jgi:tetratricopeptide (TPR) repeat protein
MSNLDNLKSDDVYLLLYCSLIFTNNSRLIKKATKKILSLNRENDLIKELVGLVYFQNKQYEKSLEIYLNIDELSCRALKQIACIYVVNKDYENALKYLNKVSTITTELLEEKILCCIGLQKFDDALNYIIEIANINPDLEKLISCADFCYKIKKYYKSLEFCFEALKIKKDEVNIYKIMALSYYDLEQYEAALNCCNKMINLEPNNKFSYVQKAVSLVKLNRHTEAFELLNVNNIDFSVIHNFFE